MGNLNYAVYRRNYTGESVTYVENEQMKSVFVNPRDLPYDMSVKSAVVLGNGISRLAPDIQMILNQNNKRVSEGYKFTYACNAAWKDTSADYYVIKNNIFFSEIPVDKYNKLFTSNNHWHVYPDTNLLPYSYHFDSGSSAAYLAAFDGAQKIFLFGFDGCDGEFYNNVYEHSLGYEHDVGLNEYNYSYLYNVVRVYSGTQFYRVRNHHTTDLSPSLKDLPNYQEISVRDAVLLGDF
jgi:hypothetical protein